jgi:S1-C subfamily serine protease
MPSMSLEAFSQSLADLVAAASERVVRLSSHRAQSSGFFWRPDTIVTSDEALAEEGEVSVVLPGGEVRPAKVLGRDATTDIALLRVEGTKVPPVAFSEAPVRAGALALVVGAAAEGPRAAIGSVAAAGPSWLSMRGGKIDARIELELRLRRVAQGGVALDASGRAIGMATFGPRRRVLVIPAATIERAAGVLASQGRVPRGFLGLGLQPVRLEGVEGVGAFITGVVKDGPGEQAGARQGDVVVAWNGAPLRGVHSLLRALGPDSVGAKVTLGLRRAGEPLDLALTIGERPSP